MSVFEAGEKVLMIDSRERRYLVTLRSGGEFHFHRGIVQHDDIIGQHEGRELVSTGGERLTVLRPTYADFVLKMPRGAQVIYPKDAAMIVMMGDIYPGAHVLEAGAGSGAMSIALARAVGPAGKVITYELREDFAAVAAANVEALMGKAENLEIRMGDIYDPEPMEQESFDRAVLDVSEPWRALDRIEACLRPGGILTCYLPTILQVHELTRRLAERTGWTLIQTSETLVRTWHVEERAVRPDHRMVAHTGYITVGRLVG